MKQLYAWIIFANTGRGTEASGRGTEAKNPGRS